MRSYVVWFGCLIVAAAACGELLGVDEYRTSTSSSSGGGGGTTTTTGVAGNDAGPGGDGGEGGGSGGAGGSGGFGGGGGAGGSSVCDGWSGTYTSPYHCEGYLAIDSAPEVFDFAGKAAFSVELWLRPTTTAAAVNRRSLVDNRDSLRGWSLFIDSQAMLGKVTFERVVNGGPLAVVGIALTIGVPAHVVATYDGAYLRIYIDGQLRNSQGDARPMGHSTDLIHVARSYATSPAAFVGFLDELAIYPHELPLDRVEAHFAAGDAP
ncbi:MAG: LamG domain-containing protein [Deltaproteobacteria bacterium]|nr:LamG domain-containing protein [Deltaproteobacteria bacterium]